MKGFGWWGRQTAIRIMRRITMAPRAIPRIAALEIETARQNVVQLLAISYSTIRFGKSFSFDVSLSPRSVGRGARQFELSQ